MARTMSIQISDILSQSAGKVKRICAGRQGMGEMIRILYREQEIRKGRILMKRIVFLLVFALCLSLGMSALAAVSALSVGTLEPLEARPNQKLALRSGPGTKYSEVFSIAASGVTDFAIYQQEKGGSAMWGMIEFDSRHGRYRVYTGMKRIDTDKSLVPMGNTEGVLCAVGRDGVRAYYGPGEYYAPVEERLPAWTEVIVYHEENGWAMADFVLPGAKDDQYDEDQKQLTRAWIPIWALSGYESAEVYEVYEDCGGEGEWEEVG